MRAASSAAIKKRSVLLAGHATSLSLNRLVASVDATRAGNLSSALRVFVLECCRCGELGAATAAAAGS